MMEDRYWQITYYASGESLPRTMLILSSSVYDAINECGLSDLDAIIEVTFVPRMEYHDKSDTSADGD